ncbi:MDR family MFS transporter [Levilactobacillus cerevisiae]|uniref:MDR family MFS transporter n=1 Tax=Levilactobacillus cerevisiae TaxID=1704076 RepID=UPI000F798461|nr:MDR family MFS transporter [Levilactobacillus cerevisiae]
MTNRQRTLIFLDIMVTVVSGSALATALSTALPVMINQFHVSVTTGQWLTSGFSLAMGIVMPLTAFLITRFPTKPLFISGISLLIAGMVISVIAPNFTIMMIGRVMQALGNGLLSAMAQVILLAIYPPEKRGSIMGWYGLSIGAAPVLAPTLAGILVDTWGWQSIFYLIIGLLTVALIMALIVFKNVLDVRKQKFDVSSFVISAIAFAGLTIGIGNVGTAKFVSVTVLLPIVLGLLAGVLFTRRQLKQTDPFLDLTTFKDRNFSLAVIGSVLLYFAMMGSSIILPLMVQTVQGASATVSGLVTLPGSLAMAIISPFVGRIYDRFGMRRLFIVGGISLVLSNLGMVPLGVHSSLITFAAWNVLRSVSIGCLMMPLVTWGMASFTPTQMAHGTALINALRTIGGAIGSAIFVGVMNFVAKNTSQLAASSALMRGVNVAYLGMAVVSVGLLVVAFLTPKRPSATVPLD